MKAAFIIQVEKDLNQIESAFAESKTIRNKVFLKVYKARLNGLYLLIRNKVSSYIVSEGDNSFEAVDKGALEEMQKAKARFENFMLGKEKELYKEKAYQQFKSDRIVMRMIRIAGKKLAVAKDKAISLALSGGTVYDFFSRIGLSVRWELKEEA